MKKIHFEILPIREYDGEYIHYKIPFGIEYSQAKFDYDDGYKEFRIGLIFFKIVISLN